MKTAPGRDHRRKYILDTSAIFAFREDEEGCDKVESLLREAQAGEVEVYASFMTYMEAYYRVIQIEGEEAAKSMYAELKSLPIYRVDVNEAILLQAGEIKAKHRLSVAGAWIIATALNIEGTLVHRDPEFGQVEGKVSVLKLPYLT
ncbi:MAG TPA: PIN domain-containing protein [Candidatus Latescibacteria bacterium]|nr:PIN domain-containing protein [Candidatus Latescibacterota bacterium]